MKYGVMWKRRIVCLEINPSCKFRSKKAHPICMAWFCNKWVADFLPNLFHLHGIYLMLTQLILIHNEIKRDSLTIPLPFSYKLWLILIFDFSGKRAWLSQSFKASPRDIRRWEGNQTRNAWRKKTSFLQSISGAILLYFFSTASKMH